MVIWSIAKATIGDALRKKTLQIFLVIAIGLIVISLSFSQTLSFSTKAGASTDLMLIKSFGLGLMAIAGMFIALVMGVSLIPQEIERKTIYTILSKPVNRYEFIIGKFLGAIVTLAINIGIMGVVFIAVIAFKAMGAEVSMAPIESGDISGVVAQKIGWFDVNMVWSVILIFMQFMVLSSVVLFFSTFLAPTANFFMGAGVYIIGSLSPMTKTIASSPEANPLIKGFYKLLSSGMIVPNFDRFNITNALLHPEAHVTNLGMYTLKAGIMGVVYVLIMMILAVLIFWRKEV